jgi:hypothetical protein
MPAAPPDTESTTVSTRPPKAGTPDPTSAGSDRSRVWLLPLVVLLGWFAGLAPWFVARRTVGTFGTPWNPRNDMRDALLPFHHERLVLLLSVVLMGGALAGGAPWLLRLRRRRLGALTLVVLTAAVAVGGSVLQTLSLHPDLGGTGTTERTVRTALVLLAAGGAAIGLLLGLLVSLGSPALRLLAAAPLAVVTANWLGVLVTHVSGDASNPSRHETLPTVLVIVTGVVVGLGLALGPRLTSGARAVGLPILWLLALALVWVTQSAHTAVRYFLENAARGSRVDVLELRSLARDVLRIVVETLTPANAPWREAALAVVIGTTGLVARTAWTRRGTGGVRD